MPSPLIKAAATGLVISFLLARHFWWSVKIPFSAADVEAYHFQKHLANSSIRSWEEGVYTHALLELHNPELTVYASNPFPGGQLPSVPEDASVTVPGLASAAAYIDVDGILLCDGEGSPADPASLGIQALLLSNQRPEQAYSSLPSPEAYGAAAQRQALHLVQNATKFRLNDTHAAISHRYQPAQAWGDFVYMVPPFLAYYGVATRSHDFLRAAVRECELYNAILSTNVTLPGGGTCAGTWRHIVTQPSQLPPDVCCSDPDVWLTSNAWAVAGMTRVLATVKSWVSTRASYSLEDSSFAQDAVSSLAAIIENMMACMLAQARDEVSGLLKNYLDGHDHQSAPRAFGDAAGTALVTSAIYRLAVLLPDTFMKEPYLSWADKNLQAVARHVHEDGRVGPVASINGVPSTHAVDETSEGQSMALLLYSARRDFVKSRGWTGGGLVQ